MTIKDDNSSLFAKFNVGHPKYEKKIKDVIKIFHDEVRPPFFNKRPRDEDELKAVIHAIIRCSIDSLVKRERGGARVGTKECKFDFSIFGDRDAIEVKLLANNTKYNKIIGDIEEDIKAFRNSQFKNLIYLIYDSIGDIHDVNAVKREYEEDNIHFIINKH